jgi:peptidoglycan/LPS O-acetylase OafA/YrhL
MAISGKPSAVGNAPVIGAEMKVPTSTTADDNIQKVPQPAHMPPLAQPYHSSAVQLIHPLTGARIFAALWVVMFHFRFLFEDLVPAYKKIEPLASQGDYAVPFFFILSGFILSHNYFEKYSIRTHWKFVGLRFARLWPVHLAGILVLVAFVSAVHLGHYKISLENYPFRSLPGEALMVRSWSSRSLLWNYPAWSISAEWFAYLFVFPICFLCFSKARSTIVLAILALACLALQGFDLSDTLPGRIGDIVLLFIAGSCLCRIKRLYPNLAGGLISYAGAALLVVSLFSGVIFAKFMLYISFALLVFGLSYEMGMLSALLSLRPVVWGGEVSYSLYMTHGLVQIMFYTIGLKITPSGSIGKTMLFLGLWVVLIGTAALSYYLVEQPGNAYLRSRLGLGGKAGKQK